MYDSSEKKLARGGLNIFDSTQIVNKLVWYYDVPSSLMMMIEKDTTSRLVQLAIVSVSAIAGIFFYAIQKHSKRTHEDIEELKKIKLDENTFSLFPLFQPHLIPMAEISKRGYSSALGTN